MPTFSSSSEAKQFLIDRIVAEAKRTDTPLSELETQMLWFTETEPTPIDVDAVNEAFEREYNNEEYEAKIADLVQGFREHARRNDPAALAQWKEAEHRLRGEDHYLLVMIDIGKEKSSLPRPLYVLIISVVAGAAVCGLIEAVLWITRR